MNKQPIGIFDSGYGGLTVLKEIINTLPAYDYLYLGDNLRAPYGNKTFETVYQYTLEAVKWLFNQDCHLIILACNTASAKALRSIQQNDLPGIDPAKRVLGVIRPTAEVIGKFTKTNHIGVLGTSGTIQSESYLIEIGKFFPHLKVSQEACPEWVELVENNLYQSKAADEPVKNHIQHILGADASIDALLLACTHYPLLLPKIEEHVPAGIKIISQGEIVAQSLKDYLGSHPEIVKKCTQTQTRRFCTTGDVKEFNRHAGSFFGSTVIAESVNLNEK